MISPNAETIEGAAENLSKAPSQGEYPTLNQFALNSELHELDAFGPGRFDELKAKLKMPPSVDGMTDDFRIGYLLGLQTARFCLFGSIKLRLAQPPINPVDVL